MYISFSLVVLTFLTVQCRSQALQENDRQYPTVSAHYQQIDQENLRQERQLQQLSRRQDRRVPQDYRYQYDTEQGYSAETQYQPSYSETPNNRIITPPGRPEKPQPTIEQYLKEVTPTTKTSYDPRNYPAPSHAQPQTAEEYFLHPEQQKRPFIQHAARYELPQAPKEPVVPQNVLAYQNAIIAHQNAIYEQQRADQLQKQQQDNVLKPSNYVAPNIQKKPTKLVKPKPSTLDEEIDYLTSLQYQQHQVQHQVQQQNKAYEVKQPAPAKYQARIPQYSKPELLAEEEQAQAYQPQIQYSPPARFAKPSKSPKFQIYQPQYQPEPRYQPVTEKVAPKFEDFDPSQYEHLLQYQPVPQAQPQGQPQAHPQPQVQSQPSYSASPKYVPEQKYQQYQEPLLVKYQPQPSLPTEDALQKYRASLAKYQTSGGSNSKIYKPRPQVKPQYVQEEQPQQIRYQAQQYEQPAQHQQPQHQPQSHIQQHQPQPQSHLQQSRPIYQGPTDEEYKQSDFKQSLGLNSSLRVLKSGKPVVFVGHEE